MPCDTHNSDEAASAENNAVKPDLPDGVPPLTSLYLYISDACNLNCRHCWITPVYSPSRENGHFLQPEYIEKAIQEAGSLGLRTVKLTGGEPFLHPDIREILSLISNYGFKINIETNGTKIDPGMARYLRETEKFFFISVSLDGLEAKSHDWFRGVNGSFNKAVDGIKNLVDQNIHPQLICTLHRKNEAQIDQMIDKAASLGCSSIKFNHIQPMGRGRTDPDGIRLAPDRILELYKKIDQRIRRENCIRVYLDVPYAFKSMRNLVNDRLGRCHVKNILSILAGGRISLCGIGETVADLIFGHVGKNSLKDIWLTHPVLQEIREQIPGEMEGVCAECIHRNFCMGHCIAQSYLMSKKLNSSFWFCQYARERNLFPESRLKIQNSQEVK